MPAEKLNPLTGLLIGVGGLLAVYVFFPVILIIPLIPCVEHHWISNTTVESVFAPLERLGQAFPPYEAMIRGEVRLCRRLGFDP